MWRQKSESSSSPVFVPVQPTPTSSITTLTESSVTVSAAEPGGDGGIIVKGITMRGEISGTDSLHIDGTVEGTVKIPGARVTVGSHGRVTALHSSDGTCIVAREIVILGVVAGDVEATELVDLRARGSLSGNVSTARVAIEDGAYFKGGIDIRRADKAAETQAQKQRRPMTGQAGEQSNAQETVQV